MAHNDCKPLPQLTKRDVLRFFSKVDSRNPSECWPWRGTKGTWGYGYFGICRNSKNFHLKASRVAYFLHYGEDPYPLFILHRCDNHGCCNPAHLFKGTQTENIADMMAKGRSSAGKKRRSFPQKPENHTDTLSREQIIEARRLLSIGVRTQAIATAYGVSYKTIDRIRVGKRWAHIV